MEYRDTRSEIQEGNLGDLYVGVYLIGWGSSQWICLGMDGLGYDSEVGRCEELEKDSRPGSIELLAMVIKRLERVGRLEGVTRSYANGWKRWLDVWTVFGVGWVEVVKWERVGFCRRKRKES
jgi:hypothetical protein